MSFPLLSNTMKSTLAARRKAAELKDLDVDRVDAVDKPATGRNFLFFKSEDGAADPPVKDVDADADSDEMPDEEKRQRGVTAKRSIFRNIISPDTREFPIETQGAGGPRVADEGEDAMGRDYGNAVMDRIAGAFSRKEGGDPDAIPNAGAGETWEGDTRRIDYPSETFSRDAAAYIGGVTVDGRPAKPTQEYLDNEAGMPTRVGDMRLLNPGNAGIASPAGFLEPEPAERVTKSRVGIFKSVVFGKKGDQADGFLSEE